jgi:hypothetical protein
LVVRDVEDRDKPAMMDMEYLFRGRGFQMAVDESSEDLRRHSGRLPLNFGAVVIWFLVTVAGVAFWVFLVPAVAPLIVSLVHHISQAQIPPK